LSSRPAASERPAGAGLRRPGGALAALEARANGRQPRQRSKTDLLRRCSAGRRRCRPRCGCCHYGCERKLGSTPWLHAAAPRRGGRRQTDRPPVRQRRYGSRPVRPAPESIAMLARTRAVPVPGRDERAGSTVVERKRRVGRRRCGCARGGAQAGAVADRLAPTCSGLVEQDGSAVASPTAPEPTVARRDAGRRPQGRGRTPRAGARR